MKTGGVVYCLKKKHYPISSMLGLMIPPDPFSKIIIKHKQLTMKNLHDNKMPNLSEEGESMSSALTDSRQQTAVQGCISLQ